MGEKVYFKETQSFNKKLPIGILTILFLAWIIAMIWQIYLDHPIGPYPVNNLGIVLIGFVLLSPFVLMLFLRMETQIRPDGVFYKLKPLEFSWHKIAKENIVSYAIAKGTNGKQLIKLSLKNGKDILIGTANKEKFLSTLEKRFPLVS